MVSGTIEKLVNTEQLATTINRGAAHFSSYYIVDALISVSNQEFFLLLFLNQQ